MDQARSTITKIFNGEPHSYTRFNLTQNMEGDNSHVEMKLSSDMDEEAGGNGVGAHLNHNSNHKSYMTSKFERTPKHLCFMVATVLLIFIIGYLIGYLVHRQRDLAPSCEASVQLSEEPVVHEPVVHETEAAPVMAWNDVKNAFAQKLTASNFQSAFSDLSSESHRAGSSSDDALADKVIKKFQEYGLKTWTDEHFIKVQDRPLSGSNKVIFKNGREERPGGFLSYSANGNVKGAVLYAYYGQESDFRMLRDRNINMSGRVMLIRAGKISFAEKVANAAKMKASAVLIYQDPTDYPSEGTTQLFGHVHLGSGDPYTPGFPSFNHTQFPPAESSGLPNILAQTITTSTATSIIAQLEGQIAPEEWGDFNKLGSENDVVTVEVENVLTEKKINNVFGVIEGFVDADRYLVIGAQRDAWGPGFAASTVGTGVLLEMARSISDMLRKDGFKPRRSIVFASWSAGEYGSVGATEWLEGYLSSLSTKAFSYINLDGIVAGHNGFKVAASPMMYGLIERTLKEVSVQNRAESLFSEFGKGNWEANMLEPLKLDNAAYPFMAFSGIPSLSFRFTSGNIDYPYFGTLLDTQEKLIAVTSNQHLQLAEAAAKFAGHIALRLVHDHLLQMDLIKYDKIIRTHVAQINRKVNTVQRMQPNLVPTSVQWLISASGSYSRASRNLMKDIQNSDLEDIEMCRIYNDRIMSVERNLLSAYVSARESPFRHVLLGSGPHTLKGLSNHLDALRTESPEADVDRFRNQFALATWTIQGCANALVGDMWSFDNEI
ncbi:transferrin receptor 1a isoform X2 [Phyllopteryx taeniolatus]|nr:transferrin receptor 1a isoform X2 [Phyllopteryx taeniolatus]XP_061654710.1 transferrin receptor 1a isoform X2 [Phyllopteryx taeniolatus]XP_061654711.1 transferrin receptor 1a isoform X2 [Phyllopteryx taeniolatus]XP_061654713.1 transferrin receptor 1a isoform X2 [Phyllopteryx taeniolatus]XP_061654714.1 transferrin receptor 1a isoform X2 [Phyllopteryx taeniolatus]